MNERPEPPKEWSGKLILVYPDGSQTDMDLNGTMVWPGEPIPGKNLVLDRFDVSERPGKDGLYRVVGILRESS